MTELAKIERDEPQIVRHEDAPMVAMIERIAMDPSIPIDRLEQMLAMKERMDKQAAEKAYAAAFAKMQAAIPIIKERGAIKNRDGNVQSTYPLWEDVIAALRGPLADNGLSMSFDRRREDGKVYYGCIIRHEMGHATRTEIDLPRDNSGSKNEVQGEGSSVSYGQRYASKMAINWISEGTEDDDGEAAGRSETITPDQWNELTNLLERSGSDETKFLSYFRVQRLEDLPQSRLKEAVNMLLAKIKQKGSR